MTSCKQLCAVFFSIEVLQHQKPTNPQAIAIVDMSNQHVEAVSEGTRPLKTAKGRNPCRVAFWHQMACVWTTLLFLMLVTPKVSAEPSRLLCPPDSPRDMGWRFIIDPEMESIRQYNFEETNPLQNISVVKWTDEVIEFNAEWNGRIMYFSLNLRRAILSVSSRSISRSRASNPLHLPCVVVPKF